MYSRGRGSEKRKTLEMDKWYQRNRSEEPGSQVRRIPMAKDRFFSTKASKCEGLYVMRNWEKAEVGDTEGVGVQVSSKCAGGTGVASRGRPCGRAQA